MVGFWLEFDTAMDPAAASDHANYSVVEFRRHGRRLVARRVAFRVGYIADTQRATLTLIGRPKFAAGGELVVHAAPPGGLVDAGGIPLDGGNQGVLGDDGSFAIAPKGKAISRLGRAPVEKDQGGLSSPPPKFRGHYRSSGDTIPEVPGTLYRIDEWVWDCFGPTTPSCVAVSSNRSPEGA